MFFQTPRNISHLWIEHSIRLSQVLPSWPADLLFDVEREEQKLLNLSGRHSYGLLFLVQRQPANRAFYFLSWIDFQLLKFSQRALRTVLADNSPS